jgi:hypothetical protein
MDISDNLDRLLKQKGQVFDFMQMASMMKNKFEKYFGDEGRKNMLFEFAVILDPRMKLQIIQFSCERNCMLIREQLDKVKEDDEKMTDEEFNKMVKVLVDDVKDEMKLLVKDYEVLYKTGSSNPSNTDNKFEKFRSGDDSFLDAFQQYRGGGVMCCKTHRFSGLVLV